jgi:hypothetical protein
VVSRDNARGKFTFSERIFVMKKVLLTLFAMLTLAGGAWAAGCCNSGADCCTKACCKKAH